MGCDIHLWIERRERPGASWELVRSPLTCAYCQGSGTWSSPADERAGECMFCNGTGKVGRLSVRNYYLFSVLANVRNGYGSNPPEWRKRFARPGVVDVDSEPIEPISLPRGWPVDLSDEVRKIIAWAEDDSADGLPFPEQSCPGEHSESWLYLSEIEAYFAKPREVVLRGLVMFRDFEGFPSNGAGYSGGVGGAGTKVITPDEARTMIARGEKPPPDQFLYVNMEWTANVASLMGGWFFDIFLPELRALGSGENVRLVFNFDS